MDKIEIITRMQCLSLRIIKMIDGLSYTRTSVILSNQLIRSATSMGANYRACCRAKSRKDFISKLKIVEEETDETIYWLDLIEKTQQLSLEKLLPLKTEAKELLAIVVASLKTAKRNSSNCKL